MYLEVVNSHVSKKGGGLSFIKRKRPTIL